LDCTGATFVDPGFIALFHHLWTAKPQALTIKLPSHPAACTYMLKHLEHQNKAGLALRLPTDFPLRRVGKEELVVSEIGAWRKMLVDCGVPEQEARSFGSIMSEVLTNSFQHGGPLAQPPIIAGQTFSKQAHSTLVAIDQGQSIPRSLRNAEHLASLSPCADHVWIETALENGVTARTRPTNRGIGLYHLGKKVQENGGSLCIVSGNGVLALGGGIVKSQPLAHKHFPDFPGTMLILDIKRMRPQLV
jgi:hypothetical protein